MHWPQNIPDTKNIITRWEEYPGTQSILIPAEGIAHECITSLDEANKCNRTSIGIAIAPVACNLTIFVTPLRIGLYWFLCKSWFEARLSPLMRIGERKI